MTSPNHSSAQITFTMAQQSDFARLSGDYNPIHLDPAVGRRSVFGGVTVHGINLLLSCLRIGLPADKHKISSLKAVFVRPVLVNRVVDISFSGRLGKIDCLVESEGIVCARIRFAVVDVEDSQVESNLAQDTGVGEEAPATAAISIGQIHTRSLCADFGLCEEIYPNLSAQLTWSDITSLLATTYIVGMRCPGLQSIYSRLSYQEENSRSNVLQAKVVDHDKRYNQVQLDFQSDLSSGSITAFIRPSAVAQATYDEIENLVEPNRYSGVRALVIGGSRGIGELISKIVCAGGGVVHGTYVESDQAAKQLQATLGASRATIQRFDVTDTSEQECKKLISDFGPTHVFYLATPHIFSGQRGRISLQNLKRFHMFYVESFLLIVQSAIDLGVKNVFSPSTVALDDHPDAMAEYVIAKSAFESLCAYLIQDNSALNLAYPRLPRLETDQTASISQIPSEDTLQVVLNTLSEFIESQTDINQS